MVCFKIKVSCQINTIINTDHAEIIRENAPSVEHQGFIGMKTNECT